MTIKYKIRKNPFGDSSRDEIEKIGECIIPRDLNNRSYKQFLQDAKTIGICLLYTSPSPRDRTRSRMPSSA